MVSLKRTFEASPPDYTSIQSELDHWKNLTFSFDMSDEQHPSKSSSQQASSSDRARDSSETKEMQDAVLLAQFAEASRAMLPPAQSVMQQQQHQMNAPLDPSLVALLQALQSVQGQGYQQPNFSHPFFGFQQGQPNSNAPFPTPNALSQLLQQPSGSTNQSSFADQYPSPQMMQSFLDHFPEYNQPSSSQSGSSSSAAQPAPSVASTSSSPPTDDVFDDKRRRNTAASARFRIKKKQRTLNLERSVSDLTGRAEELEREASDLRRENGWLKEIIMLKSSRLQLTPDTVSSSMWDSARGEGAKGPEEEEEPAEESSDSEYTEDTKGKGKARAKGKSKKT